MFSLLNIWAVLGSMVASIVFGFLWYGPLFGKPWMRLSGIVMPSEKPSTGMMVKASHHFTHWCISPDLWSFKHTGVP